MAKGFNPIKAHGTKGNEDPGSTADMRGEYNPLARTPYDQGQTVGGSGNGEYNPILSTPYDAGSQVYGGERYLYESNPNGPVSDGPRKNDIKRLPASSTNPGQDVSDTAGQYEPTHFGIHGPWTEEYHSEPRFKDTDVEEAGYKLVGTYHTIEDDEIPNDHSWGEESRNWQANYFDVPEYGENEDEEH